MGGWKSREIVISALQLTLIHEPATANEAQNGTASE
jgi:hypothetical protein